MDKGNIFEQLEKLQDEKDIDKIADLFLVILSMYGMKMDEVAALNFYVMQKSLESKHNADFIKEHFKMDATKLGISGVLDFQQALIASYLEKLKNKG
jgi:hypothetical protein